MIPIVVSNDGKIANGIKRLFAYAKQGVEMIPEIWQQWKFSPVLLYVVRFKVEEIFNADSPKP